MSEATNNVPAAVLDALRQASSVVAMTGAGVSAESGVPTFRDAQTGLWAKYKPEELATPDAFVNDPLTAWNWYRSRRRQVSKVAPNAGHTALSKLAMQLPAFQLITQNVDGLHQAAGSTNVIEFHGNLFVDRCDGCDARSKPDNHAEVSTSPSCPSCGASLRPGVVLFGELIPERALRAAMEATANCDVFMSIGTSSLVYPAAGLAQTALAHGAMLIEINTETTPLSGIADAVITGASATVLPKLVAALQ